ncbi:MAG: ferritin-like domain-containing protein [Acidobacteria bacterium]|nr:ferritin-like domain-containing protein [Acidobacteriota bacterium]
MESQEFITSLVLEMETLFSHLGELEILESESDGKPEVIHLLKLALKSELEASELAAAWMASTPEIDAKRLLAAQCGDEMKHYQLILERLKALGAEMGSFDPMAEGYSPLFHYLRGLRSSVERIAAGPFACEAVARVRNQQFIAFCRSAGDFKTAELYETIIQPDEVHHHVWARDFLAAHCTTPELQELAASATRSSLAVADELRSLMTKTTGLAAIPMS